MSLCEPSRSLDLSEFAFLRFFSVSLVSVKWLLSQLSSLWSCSYMAMVEWYIPHNDHHWFSTFTVLKSLSILFPVSHQHGLFWDHYQDFFLSLFSFLVFYLLVCLYNVGRPCPSLSISIVSIFRINKRDVLGLWGEFLVFYPAPILSLHLDVQIASRIKTSFIHPQEPAITWRADSQIHFQNMSQGYENQVHTTLNFPPYDWRVYKQI